MTGGVDYAFRAGMAAGQLEQARQIIAGERPPHLFGRRHLPPAQLALEHLASAIGWLETAARLKA
jgi:hypothetical protein